MPQIQFPLQLNQSNPWYAHLNRKGKASVRQCQTESEIRAEFQKIYGSHYLDSHDFTRKTLAQQIKTAHVSDILNTPNRQTYYNHFITRGVSLNTVIMIDAFMYNHRYLFDLGEYFLATPALPEELEQRLSAALYYHFLQAWDTQDRCPIVIINRYTEKIRTHAVVHVLLPENEHDFLHVYFDSGYFSQPQGFYHKHYLEAKQIVDRCIQQVSRMSPQVGFRIKVQHLDCNVNLQNFQMCAVMSRNFAYSLLACRNHTELLKQHLTNWCRYKALFDHNNQKTYADMIDFYYTIQSYMFEHYIRPGLSALKHKNDETRVKASIDLTRRMLLQQPFSTWDGILDLVDKISSLLLLKPGNYEQQLTFYTKHRANQVRIIHNKLSPWGRYAKYMDETDKTNTLKSTPQTHIDEYSPRKLPPSWMKIPQYSPFQVKTPVFKSYRYEGNAVVIDDDDD